MNYHKILMAIDDGPAAEHVAVNGFNIAKQLNAEIALVSVVDTALFMTTEGFSSKEMEEIMRNDFKKSQQMLINKVFKEYKVRTFIEEGKPYEMILKVAGEWKADIIVMGTYGRTGLPHVLMGSVAEKVIRHSTKPVFIIPAKKE